MILALTAAFWSSYEGDECIQESSSSNEETQALRQ